MGDTFPEVEQLDGWRDGSTTEQSELHVLAGTFR